MSEKLISPGVFTKENDQSFIQSGVESISTAFIGPTNAGPAFVPVQITSAGDFDTVFGGDSDSSYIPYSVKSYLNYGASALVCRTLGNEQWSTKGLRIDIKSGSITYTKAILIPTAQNALASVKPSAVSYTNSVGTFYFQSSGSYAATTCSLISTDTNSLTAMFSSSPFSYSEGVVNWQSNWYVYKEQNLDTFIASGGGKLTASMTLIDLVSSEAYADATTPYIRSQNSDNLFKFEAISSGQSGNTRIKVSISEIKTGSLTTYGSFNVFVRKFDDTDTNQSVLESYVNCNLDPTSPNFILTKIGTQKLTITSEGKMIVDGLYPNKSNYIRVIPSDILEHVNNTSIPVGHAPYTEVGAFAYNVNDIKVTAQVDSRGASNSKIHFGVNFTKAKSLFEKSNINIADSWLAQVSTEITLGVVSENKFTVGFQGGYDGMPENRKLNMDADIVNTNTFGYDLSTVSSSGTNVFKQALDALRNVDSYDVKDIFIPGININDHPFVVDYASDLCLERQDCTYIFDATGLESNVTSAASSVESYDNNYVATYYPWLKVRTLTGLYKWLPPTALMPAVFAFNDTHGGEWFAPAGYNRGVLDMCLDVKDRITADEKDTLYSGRVNPIIWSNGKVVVIGQKDLQLKSSKLDRLNVRRLLIKLKKFVASTSKYLLFEPNNNETRKQFLSIVEPYLKFIKDKQGLNAATVVMDETNNTPDVVDRNILKGAIYLQPTPAAEFIVIDFNVMPTGSTFVNG